MALPDINPRNLVVLARVLGPDGQGSISLTLDTLNNTFYVTDDNGSSVAIDTADLSAYLLKVNTSSVTLSSTDNLTISATNSVAITGTTFSSSSTNIVFSALPATASVSGQLYKAAGFVRIV